MYEEDTYQPKNWRPVLAYVLAFSFALGAFFSGLSVGQGLQGSAHTAGFFGLFTTDNAAEAAEEGKPDLT